MSDTDMAFIAGLILGGIIVSLLIVATAWFFGCHAALGDLCMVVHP